MIRTFGLSLLACSALASVACYDRAEDEVEIVHPTLIGVSPSDFLGSVPCVDGQGGMKSYIATIFDVSDELPVQSFQLASSSLVPCRQAITFVYVVPGHRYTAWVQGYDRDDLKSQGPGSPNAVDDEGHVVAPRWTTECGRFGYADGAGGAAGAGGEGSDGTSDGFSLGGVTATSHYTVYTDYCLPLAEHGPPSDTAISIDLSSALTHLECGSEAGEVETFSAELVGETAPPEHADCGDSVRFSDLVAGRDYRFTVLAFEAAGASPRWQTTCRATALSGAETPASCDPLAER